jgi:hypothetical protein
MKDGKAGRAIFPVGNNGMVCRCRERCPWNNVEGQSLKNQNNLTRVGEGVGHCRVIVIVRLNGQPRIEVVVVMTECDGYFIDEAQSEGDLLALLIQIRDEVHPAGAVEHHACKDEKYDSLSNHAAKIGAAQLDARICL